MTVDTIKNSVWFEKYRPQKIEDCILPATLKKSFQGFVKEGHHPHLMLFGSHGIGKTTLAMALARELGASTMFLNTSDDRGIDTFRTMIEPFASSMSLDSEAQHKVCILDEFDESSPALQGALRGGMERLSANCRFILTGNFRSKIIKPLFSRCTEFSFAITKENKPELMAQFHKRCLVILEQEGVKVDPKALAAFIAKNFPDYRKCLNELQGYSMAAGVIDDGILTYTDTGAVMDSLWAMLKKKDFTGVMTWVYENSTVSPENLFQSLYSGMKRNVEPGKMPAMVLILADYQHKSYFCANQTINTVACLTELMSECF